jgi:aromatic ring-opening dioxygenase LigB subunit
VSPIVYAALMPHWPWLLPEVGGGRERPLMRTLASARRVGRDLAVCDIDTVVVLTPHGPTRAGAPAVCTASRPRTDFAEFGQPDLVIERETDAELQIALAGEGVATSEEAALDRGVAVPLYFLARALPSARLLAVGVPPLASVDDPEALVDFGERLRGVTDALGRSVALLASGELSHRLFAGAPGGFEPRAEAFDTAVQEAVAEGEPSRVLALPRELVAAVDEHALGTIAVAAGALGGLALLRHSDAAAGSYESPFGVGQLVAVLYRAST